ncbi:short subunit dehydrogenase [Ancylobacter aquaticus]|uniref:Short subunit dehydrogenase n=1 Tax=Ancylobacter aquaticus TaxID=100 RepID=A0A4R1HCF3_ANCAQ|nr:short subunit dehydrogenase [Ancylobacter aquaticus]
MYNLDGRVAVITGRAVGIGRGIATRLAQEGCDVAVLDLDLAGAQETAAMVQVTGRRALVLAVDVADADAVATAMDQVKVALGPIDIAVNNAAITAVGKVVDIRASTSFRSAASAAPTTLPAWSPSLPPTNPRT